MNKILIIAISTVLSIIISSIAYPYILRFAKKRNVVDNPDARKLRREPVPVMGGVVAYISILLSTLAASLLFKFEFPFTLIIAVTVMLCIGVWDDIKDIPATLRFVLEVILVWSVMYFSDMYICHFNGLWGLHDIEMIWAIPLSIVAGVGIINAINLIDGVDGYCSGFSIVSCILFSVSFFISGNTMMGTIALICAGALIPFLFHNIFGKKSKMFLGDGGALMIGTFLMYFVFNTLSNKPQSDNWENLGVGILPYTLAVLSIPILDTLRVMGARIVRGKSPFSADMTHLHHLFISAGYSHAGTSFCCISLNLLIVLIWYISFLSGAGINLQFVIVLILGVSSTFIFYKYEKKQQYGDTKQYNLFCKIGNLSHKEKCGIWKRLQHLADRSY